MLTIYEESPYMYDAGPIRFFKCVWGLPARTEDPQIQVLENLPRYNRELLYIWLIRDRHVNQFNGRHAVDSRVYQP